MITLLLILFMIFSILIYYINNYIILSILLLISISISLKLHLLKKNKYIFYFIIITFLFNILFSSFISSILVISRLIIIYLITIIFTNYYSINEISKALSNLFFFTKKRRDIELIITITFSFIPILIDETKSIKKSLIVKNFDFNLKNVLLKPNIFINTFINNLFIRIKDVEKVLLAKNY